MNKKIHRNVPLNFFIKVNILKQAQVIFMQSVMEIALPVKKLSSKNWSNLSGVF
jgi:hypothetical protein